MPIVKDIIQFLEGKFPPSLAYEWDNVGLQLGNLNAQVKKIMIALDATTPVIDEAVEKGVDLIITHHPFFFVGVKQVDFGTPKGQNIGKLIKHDITLYSMHTNYDIADGGMNDVLASKMELQNVKSFSMIDEDHGLGRIGELIADMTLVDFSDKVENHWLANEVHHTQMVDASSGGLVGKVAIIAGSGGKYFEDAKHAGADVFVTGDMDYHTAVDAIEMGLSIVDIGHYAEVVMEQHVAGLLADKFDIEITVPTASKNPIE